MEDKNIPHEWLRSKGLVHFVDSFGERWLIPIEGDQVDPGGGRHVYRLASLRSGYTVPFESKLPDPYDRALEEYLKSIKVKSLPTE